MIEPALIRHCVANDRLHLILMPTEACNFRCTYCYEDFTYSRMQSSVVRGITRLLTTRAPTLSRLHISWFGGEPLLALDVVKKVMTHVRELRLRYPQIELECDMTTNGYLLSRSRLVQLLALGVARFQVSFDGPPDWHDRKRVLAGGRGTFDRIWSNLQSARELAHEFEMKVRLHVDRDNIQRLPLFLDQFQRTFGTDKRFLVFFRPLERLGGPNDAQLRILEDDETDVVQGLCRQAEKRGIRFIVAEDLDPVCYASRGNSFVVRANGRLNKCTVALEHPNNQVGRIDADGRVEVDAPKVAEWMRGLWTREADVLECPMKGLADPASQAQQPNVRLVGVGG